MDTSCSPILTLQSREPSSSTFKRAILILQLREPSFSTFMRVLLLYVLQSQWESSHLVILIIKPLLLHIYLVSLKADLASGSQIKDLTLPPLPSPHFCWKYIFIMRAIWRPNQETFAPSNQSEEVVTK